ncbi:hypothetical protein C882_1540 [Caenispirillum salinarum AK4]|uniref:O-methyltransferase, family 2 n=1 Tax=Caenispirillum salinarum AK4 TaxID=1238182 RepID=K9HR16_9PROT|nr:methyltransferase [Caenispirillum salinarum]EKV32703.1 hypothetical protein C882_1540 [Caenispirillum salinarum AK4]
MKPLGNVERISGIAFGFMASKALFSALHIGVFDQLAEGPKTVGELAEATGATEHALETLLTGLVSLELVQPTSDGKAYKNAEDTNTFLVSTSRHYYGDYLRYQIDQQMYPFMDNLGHAIKGDTDKIEFDTYETWMADKEQAEIFSRSQHGGSLGPGAVVAKSWDLSDARTLLDVGGGTGAFSIMMCKRYPELKATVLDFPNVVALAEEYIAEADMSDRIDVIGGNGLTSQWPAERDVVLMSYLFSGVPADGLETLVKNTWAALKPGGRVIIHDFMVDDDRTGPPLAAMWALQHMVFTPRAASLTPGRVMELLKAQGFGDMEEKPLIPGLTRVVSAVKPQA